MAIRKNVTALTSSQRNEFIAAVKALKSAPSRMTPPTESRYDDYVYIHLQAMEVLQIIDMTTNVRNGNWVALNQMRMPMWAHRCPAFLPWHRELLHQFELDLQGVSRNSQMALPYWDWTRSQSAGELPWTDDFLGGDGEDGPVDSGPFAGKANWPINLSQDGSEELVRGFGLANGFRSLPEPEDVAQVLSVTPYDVGPWDDTRSLATFRNQLEGWHVRPGSAEPVGLHNLVHVWVGGNRGAMLYDTSPNDPVFFLHHANIDRIWALWQTARKGALYAPVAPLPDDPGQSLDEPMIFYDPTLSSTAPWTDPPASPLKMLDHRAFGYTYDTDEPALQFSAALEATRVQMPAPPVRRALRVLSAPGAHAFTRTLGELETLADSDQSP